MTVILSDPVPELFEQLAGERFELRPLTDSTDSDCVDAEGILVYGHAAIDGGFMDRCPRLKVISNHGVGVDHINIADATERGIPVGNTPGCLDASTADMTMALMLAVARNVVSGDRYARSPHFTNYDPALLIGQEVSGSKLGIIGMGGIGAAVARRARAFDMEVLYHNRNSRPELEDALNVQYASLEQLLEVSDFVALNCPLTNETTGLIGARELATMKSSAILINMARGPVVQTDALVNALQSQQIAGAGLDVTDPEPLPRGHALLSLDNVVITPHLGSASNVTRRRMMQLAIDNLAAGIDGRELPHRVS